LIVTGCGDKTLFKQISSSHTGIHFNNAITENDTLNPLKEVNLYNGGGVGAGDFNNDGLIDLYFTGNMVRNELYLNRGNLEFENITNVSGTGETGSWSRGVSIVDINGDGLDDIYVSVAIIKDPQRRKNILYVNQGINKNGIPVFKEMAAEYGLDDTTHTSMSYFFDYDNDGDLDVYLVVNHHSDNENQHKFRPVRNDGSHPSTDRLYRNDWNESLKHPFYTNVSMEAGIKIEGYGHAAIISDFNRDGWKDIYVTNDFVPSNILYINNQDGTFTDSSRNYIKQTSRFAMGVDMQDLNNDGLLDIVELDMNPEDNLRKKMMLEANSYQTMQNFEKYHYQHQYIRNTLQVNQGRSMRSGDTLGNYVFSQAAFQSGIAETDWSWAPIIMDFDNDEFRDIIIVNGYAKDVTDHDFMVYRSRSELIAKTEDILRQIPEVKLRNYAFRNNGDLTFKDETMDWGFSIKGFSNGGIYADLDNDGDMDIVINNINDEACVYENTVDNKQKDKHFLNIRFNGDILNNGGFGAWVNLYYGGKTQVVEHSPYRGYISTHQNILHFGLGKNDKIDSIVVIWPNLKKQVLTNIAVDKLHTINIDDAKEVYHFVSESLSGHTLFRNITDSVRLNYVHKEKDYPDFIIQKLMPHKFTEYAPALASGDIDGNGLDDIVCGGNSAYPTTLFFQQKNGTFIQKKLFKESGEKPVAWDGQFAFGIGSSFRDSGILLFDADGDDDLDMYISSGGYAYKPNSSAYQDRFYINDGMGNFVLDITAIPNNYTSKFCVRASDFDRDGDLDLFIAGRVDPSSYPKPVSSLMLRNDSGNDKIKFTDVTSEVAPELINIGLVCDAVFSDFDNDGLQDLVIAGEFMPVTFLKNTNGKFKKQGEGSGVNTRVGWWNSIAPGDFDNDGDIDYVVGNLGLNSFFKASEEYPLRVTAKDFDANGSYDAFVSRYLPVSHDSLQKRQFPIHTRDEINKQMIGLRAKYTNYRSYANVTIDQMFTKEELVGALQLQANTFTSAYLRNDGGKFTMTPLPTAAQAGVIQAMVVDDFDDDGNLDVVINGNDYGTDLSYGRMDALNGLMIRGEGNGRFKPLTILQSGVYIPGNGKALIQLRNKEGGNLIAATQNNGPIKIFARRKSARAITYQPGDVSMIITFKDGRKQKRELYYGYSFLSQSALFTATNREMTSIEMTNLRGDKRTIIVN
jgi:hypothetical protein